MNARKAKRLRREAGFKPTAEEKARRFKFPGLARSARVPVYETHERTIREMGPGGKVIERKVTKVIMGKDGRTPRTPKWSEQLNADGEYILAPEYTVIPVQKPVSLEDSDRIERKRYLNLKRRGGMRL